MLTYQVHKDGAVGVQGYRAVLQEAGIGGDTCGER